MTASEHTGVWISDEPLSEGAWDGVLLRLEIPEEAITPFEWVEEGKPYREFLVPADVLNRYLPTIEEED